MGIVDLFLPGLDLSGISPGKNLGVRVLHEATIGVNECGTEAAAFTGI